MSDIRHVADNAAAKAFKRMLAHHFQTGEWDPQLVREWHEADDLWAAVNGISPEWLLDAQQEAFQEEMAELAQAEAADVPLAYRAPMAESELRALWGDR